MHDDQTIDDGRITSTGLTTPLPCRPQMFVTRLLTRDVFAIANLLVLLVLFCDFNGETTHRKQQIAYKLCARPPQYASAPLRRTPYACGAQRALLPVAVGARNIHDVRDRQTSDVRQTSDAHHRSIPPPSRGGGIIMNGDITLAASC